MKLCWYPNYYHACCTKFTVYIFLINCMFLCHTYANTLPLHLLGVGVNSIKLTWRYIYQ